MPEKRIFLIVLLLFIGTGLQAEDYSDVIERTFEVEGTPELVLKNADGFIQITPREGSKVGIKVTRRVIGAKDQDQAKKEAERISIDLDQIGNQVRATTRWPREGLRLGSRPSVEIRFEVFTPSQSNVRAEVSDGELYVSGLKGSLDLNASDGSIVASHLSGDLRLSASDGDIDLKHGSGQMDISLSDGDLRAENCSGHVRIRSGDGDVELPGFNGEAEISNGDGNVLIDGILQSMTGTIGDGDMTITVAPGSIMGSDWSLRAGDGEIVLDLPDDFSANLQLSTSDGNVQTDHPVSVVGPLSTGRLTGKIGQGGHLLQIKTSDGDIAIK